MTARILLVEDDRDLASAIAEALTRRRFGIDRVRRLDEAEAALKIGGPYDVILLDRRLPDGEGGDLFPVIARLRPRPRIVFITARDTLSERVEGLELGGDDYLVKPFEMDELAARVKAVLRRPDVVPERPVTFGPLAFHPGSFAVTLRGAPLDLPRRERFALAALIKAQGQGVLRETLMREVYGFDDEAAPNALEGHLSRIRAKLRLAQALVAIRPIRGVGYQLAMEQYADRSKR